MKLNNTEIQELKLSLQNKQISVQKHPKYKLFIYKYTQNTVFSRNWTELTLRMRGMVLDAEYNIVANCMPKFFNLEELETLNISVPKLPYKVYDKADGSLIQIFRYKGKIIVSSSGSFASPQAIVAHKLFKEKYANLKNFIEDGYTYLFELIFPKNKIVLDYGQEEKLVLFAIRKTDTGEEVTGNLSKAKELGFDVIEEIKMSLVEIKDEVKRDDFINKEGFVIVFENGFRVKMKYAEYFRLHKIVSNVNEKFVWEFISQGKPINLENIPDETFQFIKDTEAMLCKNFNAKFEYIVDVFNKTINKLSKKYGDDIPKKEFALAIIPKYKKESGVLFKLYEKKKGNEINNMIWKMVEPKYEKGESGFQSMKL